MAIPFLQHIDLNKNELQNAVVQNLGTAPSSPKEGQIYYHTSDDTIYLNTSADPSAPTWTSLGGDISGVNITAGNGLSGASVNTTTGTHTQTLTVGAGTGITVNSGDVAVTAAQTGITSILNSSLAVGRDAHNQIDFSTDNEIKFKTNNETPVIIMKASGEIEATKFDGALEGNADTATLASTVTVTESSTANTNFNVVYHDGSNALLDEAAGGGFYYNPSTEMLTVKNLNVTVKTTQKEVELINTSSGVIFEGDTDDGNETTLDVVDPTADRSILLPNASGTVALTTDLVGNEKITKKLSGDGSATTYTITHSFGTPIVQVQVLDYGDNGSGATYDVVQVEIQRNSDNAVDVIFGTAPTTAEDYLVLVSKFPAIS